MSLTPQQAHMIENWLRQKCPNHTCPACGGKDWTLLDLVSADEVSTVGVTGSVAQVPSGKSYALVLRFCDNCAHVAHFYFSSIIATMLSPP